MRSINAAFSTTKLHCAVIELPSCRWANMLPPSIQVCPVEIPGRGRRSQEPGTSDVLVLAQQLAAALPLQVRSVLHAACHPCAPGSALVLPEKTWPQTSGSSLTERLLQDMPYALFGTCLGAIVAYELVQCAGRAELPLPVALFTAAVSPPHLYAEAVAQLYAAPGSTAAGPEMMAGVLHKLQDWRSLPKDLVMQVKPLPQHAGHA